MAKESSNWTGYQKSQGVGSVAQRRQLLDMEGESPSRKRQCELLGLTRSSTYYKKKNTEDEPAMERAIESVYEEDACLGRRRMPLMLERKYGIEISEKNASESRRNLGCVLYTHIETQVLRIPELKRNPTCLRTWNSKRWTKCGTYIQVNRCNYYLCAVMDWDSRFVLG